MKRKLTHRSSSDDDAGYINAIWKKILLAGSDTNLMKEMITMVLVKKEVKVDVKVEHGVGEEGCKGQGQG